MRQALRMYKGRENIYFADLQAFLLLSKMTVTSLCSFKATIKKKIEFDLLIVCLINMIVCSISRP